MALSVSSAAFASCECLNLLDFLLVKSLLDEELLLSLVVFRVVVKGRLKAFLLKSILQAVDLIVNELAVKKLKGVFQKPVVTLFICFLDSGSKTVVKVYDRLSAVLIVLV